MTGDGPALPRRRKKTQIGRGDWSISHVTLQLACAGLVLTLGLLPGTGSVIMFLHAVCTSCITAMTTVTTYYYLLLPINTITIITTISPSVECLD